MSVRRRNCKWMVDIDFTYPNGKRRRIRKVSPVQTRRTAEQYEREVRNSLLCGSFDKEKEVKVPLFRDFAEEFIQNHALVRNKPSEVRAKKKNIAHHLNPAFGKKGMDGISQRDIERFIAEKTASGLSPKTVNNILTILRTMFSKAQEWEYINRIPKISWLKAPRPGFDFLNFEEAQALIDNADDEYRCMIVIALKTGLRQSELLGLCWSDIDFEKQIMAVRRGIVRGIEGLPKSGKGRDIPLCDDAVDALIEHRVHFNFGRYVFANEGGIPRTDSQCKRPLYNACKRAGLRRIGWHVLRHTFASHLVMRGARMKTVQELLGHYDLTMTMRYSHLSPEFRHEEVQLLNFLRHNSGTNAEISPAIRHNRLILLNKKIGGGGD